MINVNRNNALSNYHFFPLDAFKGNFEGKMSSIEENLLKPKIEKFFQAINRNKHDFDYFDYSKVFTDVEFKNSQFKNEGKSFIQFYIYEHILADVKKTKKGIEFRPKYCLTFDKDLIDNSKGYGEFKLGSKPIFYFVFIDFQEFLHTLKSIT
jgi:hypothetical protein